MVALTALTPAGGSASDHDAIKAQLSFAGWAQPVETQPAQLAFSGWAQTGAPQPAALAFAGWAQTGTVQTASLSFAGWAQNDRTQEAQLSFSGWALTDEAQEAQLSFTGWAQTNQTQAAQLAFSGWSMGETELDGTLSFAGCTRDDTIPPGPPLPQSTVQAHFSSTDTDPNMDLEGNWIVRWEDAEQSLAHVTLTKGGERLCIASGDGCWIDFTRDPAAPWSIDMVLPGITIFSTEATIGPGRRFSAQYYYSVLGHWGGTSEGTATPDVIVGEWSYGDKNGRETWERVRGGLRESGPAFSPEMICEAYALGLRVIEVPVHYGARLGGDSKHSASLVHVSRTALSMFRTICRKRFLG